MIKVLHVSFSDNYGGANIAAVRLHNSLKKKINSKMIVYNKRSKDKNIIQLKNKNSSLFSLKNYFCKLILIFQNKTFSHSLNIFDSHFLNFINNSDADIIHLHWINNEILSIRDISKIKKKLFWTLHDMWPFCGSEHYSKNNRYTKNYKYNFKNFLSIDISYFIWKLKKKYFSKKINFIAPSIWMKKKVQKSFLFKKNNVFLLRNPIDLKTWKYKKKNVKIRSYLYYVQSIFSKIKEKVLIK